MAENAPETKRRALGIGSGRIPETDCPLDPGPGLGGKVSLGLFSLKASSFLKRIPQSVSAVTDVRDKRPGYVD